MSVRLTEVEAYLGSLDPGSHAFRGERPRTRAMFGPAGHLYAYFSYGMHVCANVVTGPAGSAAAVLLRAGEVVSGTALAEARRGAVPPRRLASGPANLASALGIALAENGTDLLASTAFALEPAGAPVPATAGLRVGVSGEGGGSAYPWRLLVAGDPTVSAYRAAKPRARRASSGA